MALYKQVAVAISFVIGAYCLSITPCVQETVFAFLFRSFSSFFSNYNA